MPTSGKPFQQRAQVEPRASHHYRQAAAPGDFGNDFAGFAGIFTGRVTFLRHKHVEQMMGHAMPVAGRSFRGPDVEAPIQLEGIAVDNFAAKVLCQTQRESTLAGARGSNDGREKHLGIL